ncbi:MAG TPA: protein kinase [Gemmatimonadales bacterium]|nr:protein kinase [Gemmatimonadales bacterium]
MTELVAAALALPAEERDAFLTRECAGDSALRAEVESLVSAGGEADLFFHSLAGTAIPEAFAALTEPTGNRVGRTYGAYHVLDEIGRGGMGVVYRAEDRRLGRTVALKFLPDVALVDPHAKARLLDEARAASSLDDPNICTIYELAETPEGETFIAMAYYAGETLARRLERGPVPPAEAWPIAIGITRGLAAAHARGIVHRDLTPRNVMLASRDAVKILDFGLAGGAGDGGGAGGTPAYMPPEQILGGHPARVTGDVWTLGVTLYELFTGQRPFTGRDTGTVVEAVLAAPPIPPRKLDPKIPEALDRLILRMLEKDPAARPTDAGAARDALEPILARHRSRRTRLALTAAVTLLALFVTGLVATRGPVAAPATVPAARIVVLPIAHDTARPDAVYLAAGLHEALTRELARTRGIALVSWTASPAAGGGPAATRRRVSRALGAGAVLEGRVTGDDSVTLALHDAGSDRVVWTSTLDFGRRSDVGVGRELADGIARAVGALGPSPAPVEGGSGAVARDPRTGRVYEAVPGTLTWYEADRAAAARTYRGTRGHLATVTSPEEERFVRENLRQAVAGGYWLGGYRAASGGGAGEGWRWVTGEPFGYANWLAGNPNDYFGEDGLHYWPAADSARWNDIDRVAGFEPFVRGYLVEYEP